jgi:hypothetical protein
MTLKQWEDNGWLRPHKTSEEEITKLLAMVERNLKDTSLDISADWKFSIAYNSALINSYPSCAFMEHSEAMLSKAG